MARSRDVASPGAGGEEPLATRVARRAEARILAGDWPPGSRLPPERELCRLLEVSRSTLRVALDELEALGLVTRHQGRGTFVTRRRFDADTTTYFTLSTALRAAGGTLVTRVVSIGIEPAGRAALDELRVDAGDPLVRVERLRVLGDEPIILETALLPAGRFAGLEDRDLERRSLYDVLREDYGCEPAGATETLEPVVLTAREASLLDVRRGTPALLVHRVTEDRAGAAIEVAQALLRGDRARFLLRRRVRGDVPAPARAAVAEVLGETFAMAER